MKSQFFTTETQRRREKTNLILKLCAFASLWLFFLACAAETKGQTISGTITDAQNAPVENAEVNLSDKNKIFSRASTNAEGKFSLQTNGEKNLTLHVQAKGFAVFEKQLTDNLGAPLSIILSPQNVREEVTVSITRTESRLSETPASVIVLSRETIEQTAAQTIDDALRQVAGFTLFRRSSSKTANPTTQGANLRGLAGSGASRTSVLLDGVSLNDVFGGWTYWNRLPRIAIEQAEVLRGGASTFYGSSALSGAINLRTKSIEDKPILRFETSAGTQNTYDGSFFGAFGKKGWGAGLAVESFQTKGYIPIAENERGAADSNANSRHNSGFFTLEKRFKENETQRRRGTEFFQNARIFLQGNLFAERRDNGTRLQKNRTYFRQAIFGADFADERFGAFQFRSSIEAQVYDQTFSAVSEDRNTENLTRVQRVPSQAKNASLFWSRAFDKHALSASIDTREVRGFSDEVIFNNNRATSLIGAGGREFSFGAFAQDFWRVNEKLNINFGARFDSWKNFRAFSATRSLSNQQTTIVNFPNRDELAFSPRIAALYQVNDNFSLIASFANSFRAPTLNELYRAFRVGSVLTLANENLRAERATTFEAGANFTGFSKRLNLRGNAFLTEISNPVVSVTLNSTPNLITRQRQNVGKARSSGIELDAEFSARPSLKFSASYLFVDSRVTEFPANTNLIGKLLPQVARHQFTFQTFYRPPSRFSFSLQGRVSGAQFEDDQNILRLRPFFTLDFLGSYRLPKNLEIFTAVENILNNRYDIGLTSNRTIAAPRFVRIGLHYRIR